MTTIEIKIKALDAGIDSLDHKINYIYHEYLGNAWRDKQIKKIESHITALKELKTELEAEQEGRKEMEASQ